METLRSQRGPDGQAHKDALLRRAHDRAFAKISAASASVDAHAAVAEAIEELIDACEAYVERR